MFSVANTMRLTRRQLKRKNKGMMVGWGQPMGERGHWQVVRPFHRKQKPRGCRGCGLQPARELGGICVLPSYASLAAEESSAHRATGQQSMS